MNSQILDRIKALGGNIDHVKGESLVDDLLSISFNTVLYERPQDTPWAEADDQEPIYGLGDYIDAHQAELDADQDTFFKKLIAEYYQQTEEARGQTFWQAVLFTPYQQGTPDFDEWNRDFLEDDIDLKEIIAVTQDHQPDFLQGVYRYGFPDQYYICLSDPNLDNPTLFGTDHTVFFREVTNEGTLLDFLNCCMTPDELIAIIKAKMKL